MPTRVTSLSRRPTTGVHTGARLGTPRLVRNGSQNPRRSGYSRKLCYSVMNLFSEHTHVILWTSLLLITCGSGLRFGLMGARNSRTATPSETWTPGWPTCTICGDGMTSESIPPEYWLRKCSGCKQLRCCDCSDRVLECGNPCHKYSKQQRREPDSRSLFYPPTLQDFIDAHPECRWCLKPM